MSDVNSSSSSKLSFRAGWVLSVLPALGLLASAFMKFRQAPEVIDMFTHKFGYPTDVLVVLGILEVSCVVLYLIPKTAVLGAVLLTGYLGGAVATHVRVGDVFIPPLAIGIVVWLGLYLRDARVRALLPLRAPTA